jgi:hypothetical protein
MRLLFCRKSIINHGVLTAEPLDFMALRVDQEVSIARTDTAVAHLYRYVKARLSSQDLMLDAKADGAAMAPPSLRNLWHWIVVQAPDWRSRLRR